ncbi:MAG: cation transporter [Legionella sp.]|nr:cation transporter [Legionella sp.]
MISAAFFSFLVMSDSQTMKTVWLEDMLGIIPPASFLVASRMVRWKATANFPYGFHRIVNAAYLTSSLALFLLGVYLFCDGSIVLLKEEHPTIPVIFFADHSFWLGYLMIIALLWSSIPSTILGHIKIPLAHKLYDKILFADSKMNKASWMSGFASIFGIIGIGAGFWWADAAVGILISIDIMKDGYCNLKQSVLDLLDEVPKMLGKDKTDPLIGEVRSMIKREKWVESVNLRFRDEGHIFFGDIFIIPKKEEISTETIQKLHDKIKDYHWRLHDIMIMIAPSDTGN